MITLTDKNIAYTVENGKLRIEIDLAKNLGHSKSGKSLIVSSSKGAIAIDNGKGEQVKLNLNLYR